MGHSNSGHRFKSALSQWSGKAKNLGRLTLKQILKPLQLPLTRWALAILFLPHEALLMLGAPERREKGEK